MSDKHIIISATLYYSPDKVQSIPIDWLQRTCKWFAQYDLEPILFTANGADFRYDDCYALNSEDAALVQFGEVIPARRGALMDALRAGEINYLGLDSPWPSTNDRDNWRATVNVSTSGDLYIGIDSAFLPDEVALLRQALNMTKALFNVRYGFCYRMPLAQRPDCYAIGFVPSTLANIRDMMWHREKWEYRKKTPDELWSEELKGERRHLTGLFRGAYPVNILSESHVRSAALMSSGIGRLSKLNESLWLWELSDVELPKAQKFLASRGVLVR